MSEIEFEEVFKMYFSDVYKYVLSLCHDKDIAEEVTQETFFKAMRTIDRFNGTCKLYVWLCQIAKNTYFTLQKKHKGTVSEVDIFFSDKLDIESDYLSKEAVQRLHILLHDMKEPYKEVFTLRLFGELSFAQIGSLFDKSDSWARVIFYRAKKKLQEAMT